jgi:hypothetical protein
LLTAGLAVLTIEIYLGLYRHQPSLGTEGQMTTERDVRVSDADRDSVAAQLREHYAQGRLTMDELNERLDRVFRSRTRADLNAVTFDLPYTAPSRVLPSDGVRRGNSGPGGRGQGWNRMVWNTPYWSGAGQGGSGHNDRGGYGRRSFAGGFLAIIPVMFALWACLAVVSILAFGIGSGPSMVAVFLAAVAAIRWLFGRGRGRRRCGPIRAGRRGRRW